MDKLKIEESINRVSECMKSIKNVSVNEVCKIGIIDINNWEWAQGIGIYGMYRYFEHTKEQKDLDWIVKWVDKNIQKGLPEKNINTTAPLITVSELAKIADNEKYLELCRSWADWIIKELPKTKYGGFQHIVSDGPNTGQLWDDTLFMTVLFLAKMGVLDNRSEYLEECEYQFMLHTQYLKDSVSGLWYHGWTFEGNHNFANAFWGRGNCWITAFIPEYIELTKGNCHIKKFMIQVLKSQVEALEKYQDKSGLWHTLIDDESSYLEVSATAGFAYGILKAIRIGILDEKYKEMAIKAANAVIENIAPDGTVLNVSYGTGMGKTLQDYKDIPICPMTYGQAMVIMMLVELLKHL